MKNKQKEWHPATKPFTFRDVYCALYAFDFTGHIYKGREAEAG